MLLAERARRGMEERMRSEAGIRFGPWFRRERRRNRMARAAIGVAMVVALAIIAAMPQPDGHYISDAVSRAETLQSIDKTLFAML